MMFGNHQVGFKDIFSSKPGRNLLTRVHSESSDSALDSGSQSYSQLPYSQLDFPDSQLTQDVGAQSQLHNLSQASDSQGKKMLHKFLSTSKGPVFRDGSQERMGQDPHQQQQRNLSRLNFQQQMQQNQARARDRDEKDLLSSILSCVKDCTTDVRGAVGDIRKNLEQDSSNTQQQLLQCLQTVQSDLHGYHDKLMKAVQLKDEDRAEKCQLREQLAARDARIAELERQLEESKREQTDNLLESLQQSYTKHKTEAMAQLQKEHKNQQQELRKQGQRLETVQKNLSRDTRQLRQQLQEDNQDAFKQLGQRMDEILSGDTSEQRRQQDALRADLETYVHQLQAQHRQEVNALLQRQREELSKQEMTHYQDVITQQRSQLRHLQAKQEHQLQDSVKKQVERQGSSREEELRQMVEQLWQTEKHKAEALQQQQQQQLQQQLQNTYDKELKEMKLRHQREVEEIVNQQQQQQPQRGRAEKQPPCEMILSPVLPSWDREEDGPSVGLVAPTCVTQGDRHRHPSWSTVIGKPDEQTYETRSRSYSGTRLQKPRTSAGGSTDRVTTRGFVSPRPILARGWTSKNLFGKNVTNWSPVATVLPQVQSSGAQPLATAQPVQNRVNSSQDDDETASASAQANKTSKKGRKKRASAWGRKKSRKRSKTTGTEETQGVPQGQVFGLPVQDTVCETRLPPSKQSRSSALTSSSSEGDLKRRTVSGGRIWGTTKQDQSGPSTRGDKDIYLFDDEPLTSSTIPSRPLPVKVLPMRPCPDTKRASSRSLSNSWFSQTQSLSLKRKSDLKSEFLDSISLDSDSSESDDPDSSPAMSVMEVVLKRKVKLEKTSPLSVLVGENKKKNLNSRLNAP